MSTTTVPLDRGILRSRASRKKLRSSTILTLGYEWAESQKTQTTHTSIIDRMEERCALAWDIERLEELSFSVPLPTIPRAKGRMQSVGGYSFHFIGLHLGHPSSLRFDRSEVDIGYLWSEVKEHFQRSSTAFTSPGLIHIVNPGRFRQSLFRAYTAKTVPAYGKHGHGHARFCSLRSVSQGSRW